MREIIVAGKSTGDGKTFSVAFTDDGTKIVLTTMAPDPTGIKVTIRTWDGAPRRLDGRRQ